MELWVRSQDKRRMLKAIDFYVKETTKSTKDYVNNQNTFDIYVINVAGQAVSFGVYPTKERALEVLDEIESFMLDKTRFEYSLTIYEMPEE